MEARISLITLGVRDLGRAVEFYADGLGLRVEGSREEALEKGIVFFRLNPYLRLSLYPWGELAEDAQVKAEGQGFRGITLAHNVGRKEEVDAVLEQAVAAGAVLKKAAQEVFWGGYSGYFEDPDGHLWEVAFNPFDEVAAEAAEVERPECIVHWREIMDEDNATYPGSDELLSIGSAFGRHFGFQRLGIHHELLPPGRRTSWPHAESTEDEFIFVLEGRPEVWIDGHLYPLRPGDAVGFVAGTGIAHTFLNNSESDVRLIVVGDTKREDNKYIYPLHPRRNAEVGAGLWTDCPARELGPHDGKPDRLRESEE